MWDPDLTVYLQARGVAQWRKTVSQFVESTRVQYFIVGVILFNAVILGLETDKELMAGPAGRWLVLLDQICLGIFLVEIGLKLAAYRLLFWRSGWNVFDFFVVAVALVPGAGPWSVLRSLRVLRVLRLLTIIPSLRRVVAAFFHSIPGLSGVVVIMAIFFFTAGVLATNLFGDAFPKWFGSLGASLFSLFQIMTLESWSVAIVRPVMGEYPWAWAFFIPFIVIATFTILNLFIGIIVSTMQELNALPTPNQSNAELLELTEKIDEDLKRLRAMLEAREHAEAGKMREPTGDVRHEESPEVRPGKTRPDPG